MKFKRLLAALLSVVMVCSLSMAAVHAGYFPDVTDPDVTRATDTLRALGVLSGDENGNFKPNDHLDRASFCKMAIEVMGKSGLADAQMTRTIFSDVSSTHWARGYINLAATMELENSPGYRLMTGTGDSQFAPNRDITYQEAATMILRMLGYAEEANTSWPTGAIRQAAALKLNEGLSLTSYATPITRGQAALLFYHLLSIPAKGTDTIYANTLGSVVKDAIILSTSSVVNGQSNWILTAEGGRYRPAASVTEDLVGKRGDILLDKDGRFVTLLTDESQCVTITVAYVQGNYLYGTNDTRYAVPDTTPVYTGNDDDTLEYQQIMPNLKIGDVVTIYLKDNAVIGMFCNTVTIQSTFMVLESSSITQASLTALTGGSTNYTIRKNGSAISLSDLRQYDVLTYDPVARVITVCDVRLTCYYENASPSPSAPTTITAAGGNTFNVMTDAMSSLSKFQVGQPFTLLFTASGQVAGAIPSGFVNTGTTGSWNSGVTGSWNNNTTGSWNNNTTGSWNNNTTGSWNNNTTGSWNNTTTSLYIDGSNDFFLGYSLVSSTRPSYLNHYGTWYYDNGNICFEPNDTTWTVNSLSYYTNGYGSWSGNAFYPNRYNTGTTGSWNNSSTQTAFLSGYSNNGTNAYGSWYNYVFTPNSTYANSSVLSNMYYYAERYGYGYQSGSSFVLTSSNSGVTGSWNTGTTGSWNNASSLYIDGSNDFFLGYSLVSSSRPSYPNQYGTWYYNNGDICFEPNNTTWSSTSLSRYTSGYGTWSGSIFFPDNYNNGSSSTQLAFLTGYSNNGRNTYGSWYNYVFTPNSTYANSSTLNNMYYYAERYGYGYQSGSSFVLTNINGGATAANNGNAMGMVNSDGSSMTLLGTDVTLDLKNAANASQLRSQLVSVYGSANGKLTLTAVTLSNPTGAFNKTNMKLGSLNVSNSVRIYDQGTTGNTLTSVALSSLPASVPANQIKGYKTDSTGTVILIVLRNYTGDGSTYGLITTTYKEVEVTDKNPDGSDKVDENGNPIMIKQWLPQLVFTTPTGSTTYDTISNTNLPTGNTRLFGSLQTQSYTDPTTGETATYAYVASQLTPVSNILISNFYYSMQDGSYYLQISGRTYSVASDAMYYNSQVGNYGNPWFTSIDQLRTYAANSYVTVYVDQANYIRAIVV